jgi:hypothetical protein
MAEVKLGLRNIAYNMDRFCISSDRTANSALRVQATCMATAQAAAAAAVVSCQLNVPLSQTPAEKVREMLTQHGAILPDGI